jgi:hypothetical protein
MENRIMIWVRKDIRVIYKEVDPLGFDRASLPRVPWWSWL